MKYPKREDRKKADSANIVEFAEKVGIELNQTGSDSYKGVTHDSLVITPSTNAWFWNSRQIGGYGARSFAEKYILGESNLSNVERANKAVEMVNNAHVSTMPTKVKREPFVYNSNEISHKFDIAKDYLSQQRGISEDTLVKLNKAKLIKQDMSGNALFIWRDPHIKQKVIGVSVQGTHINHKKYGKRGTLKHIEKNSTPNFGWSFDVNTQGKSPQNLVFCESAIDAISYYESAKNTGHKLLNTRIVSMEGLKKGVVDNYIDLAQKQLKRENKELNSVVFGIDNDEAGDRFIQKMIKLQKKARHEEKQYAKSHRSIADKDSFAQDMLDFKHADERREPIAFATAPTFRSSRPPKISNAKDWNDFLKSLNSGKLALIYHSPKKSMKTSGGKSLKIENNPKVNFNSKQTRKYLTMQQSLDR